MSEVANIPQLRFPEFGDNWEEKKLGNVTSIVMGQSPDSTSYNSNGIGLYLIQGNADIKKRKTLPRVWTDTPTKECKVGDIIMTVRAPVGAVAKSIHNACIGRGVCAIRNNQHSVSNYIYQFLLSFEKKWVKFEQGSTFTAVNTKDVKSLKLILPPVQEQTKIAAFLTAVDNKIEQLSKKQELLGEYKKGLMQKIFSQAIRFKADDGGDYPDWEELKLGEVARFRRGSFPQPYGNPEWYDDEDGKPFVQVYDVAGNMRLKSTTKRKISVLAQSSSVFVPKGNVVLTIQGSIGRIALTQYDAYVDRTLLIFTGYIKEVNKQFFIYVIYLLFEIEKIKAPGGTIKTITKEALTSFKLDLPCFDEQTKIANFLSSIDNKIEQVGKQLDESKQFKKALLQQMFV